MPIPGSMPDGSLQWMQKAIAFTPRLETLLGCKLSFRSLVSLVYFQTVTIRVALQSRGEVVSRLQVEALGLEERQSR